MSFNRVMRTDFNEPAAVAAIDAVNGMIGKVAEEGAAIDAAATDLATEATQAAPETAAKVLKRVDALRVRRLANAMRELSIVPLKTTAAEAVRAAAAAEADRLQRELAAHEVRLNKTADGLEYGKDSRERHQLLVTDPTRRAILQAVNAARYASNNYHALTADDHAHAATLRAAIAAALKG